jgi:hypothetical protein
VGGGLKLRARGGGGNKRRVLSTAVEQVDPTPPELDARCGLQHTPWFLQLIHHVIPTPPSQQTPRARTSSCPTSWRKELTWRCFLVAAITIVVVRYLVATCVSRGHCAYLAWGSLAWFQQDYPAPYGQVRCRRERGRARCCCAHACRMRRGRQTQQTSETLFGQERRHLFSVPAKGKIERKGIASKPILCLLYIQN